MSDSINNIKKLLTEVSAISKKYEDIAKITGENFNIFNVLGLSTREVRTHSAFIAELLNPNGSHGQGDIFLELFIKLLKDKFHSDKEEKDKTKIVFVKENAKVIVEESIGKIAGDKGGRIDIVLKNMSHQIVIENKIYAGDQKKQLVRYDNKYPNALLLYLTLFEKEASDESTKKEGGSKLVINKDYFNITYKEDVKNWLEQCKEKAVNQPLLRETITQYINLVKQLTGQTMSSEMEKEIKGLFFNNEEETELFVKTYIKYEKYRKDKFDNIANSLTKGQTEICTEVKIEGPFNYENRRVFKYGLKKDGNIIIWIRLVKINLKFSFNYYCVNDNYEKELEEFISNSEINFKEDIDWKQDENEIFKMFKIRVKKIDKYLKGLSTQNHNTK